jgi:hypothetical protein
MFLIKILQYYRNDKLKKIETSSVTSGTCTSLGFEKEELW